MEDDTIGDRPPLRTVREIEEEIAELEARIADYGDRMAMGGMEQNRIEARIAALAWVLGRSG
jgi:hypothetical protein